VSVTQPHLGLRLFLQDRSAIRHRNCSLPLDSSDSVLSRISCARLDSPRDKTTGQFMESGRREVQNVRKE
jgi:hypothetical protein